MRASWSSRLSASRTGVALTFSRVARPGSVTRSAGLSRAVAMPSRIARYGCSASDSARNRDGRSDAVVMRLPEELSRPPQDRCNLTLVMASCETWLLYDGGASESGGDLALARMICLL